MNAGGPGNAKCGASIKDGVISSDGSASMQANLDLGGNKIVSLADPAEPQEAATKGYVDSRILVREATGSLPLTHGRNYVMVTFPEGKGLFNGKIVISGLWLEYFQGYFLKADNMNFPFINNELQLPFNVPVEAMTEHFGFEIDPMSYRLQYLELP